MLKTEEFGRRIISLYERTAKSIRPEKLLHIVRSAPVIRVQEGDVRYSHQMNLRIDERPHIALKLVNGLTYQQELAQKSFVRQMKRMELIHQNASGTVDVEQFVRELDVRGRTQTRINEMKKEIVTESREEVRHIVRKQMKEQTGALTEKVYRRLEQKLQDERRRRGL